MCRGPRVGAACPCVFTGRAAADGDATEEDRGEQQQQRGPAQAPVLRAGEQRRRRHPWGLLGDGEPLTATAFLVIPPSLLSSVCMFFAGFFFALVFVFFVCKVDHTPRLATGE